MAHNPMDPRTIITPDAFEVSPSLLGLPLAVPSRRGFASLIDLVVIGLITLVTRDIGAIVGMLVALVFVYMALRSPITRDLPTPLAWAFRASVGCLGFVILLVSVAAIWVLRSGPDLDDLVSIDNASITADGSTIGLGDVLSGLQGGVELSRAGSPSEAEAAALDIARAGIASGLDDDEILDVIEEFMPGDTEWEDEAENIAERALSVARSEVDATEAEATDSAPPLTPEAALIRYAELLREDSAAYVAMDEDERAALRERAFIAVAADTLEELEDRVSSLERDNTRTETALEASEARVQELEQGSGLLRLIRELVDRLGLAFGWGSIYFAVLLPWWKGQTVGKKLLGVRVLRLDGEPITWWHAFERAGGYAAGVATGLLGFAQVYWDPNRQGIHDKIAGTVVIRDGEPRAPGAWDAASGQTSP